MFKNQNKSSLRKVFENASILLMGDIGANLLKLLTLAIFSHSQGAEKLGYFVLFVSFIEIVDRIFNFQTWQAFIKFSASFLLKNERNKIRMLIKYCFVIDIVSLVVATFFAILSSKFILNFFDIPKEYYPFLLLMSSSILFKIIDLSTGIFRLYDKFSIQAKISVYTAFIRFVLYGIIALFFPSFKMFIYATIFSQFAAVLFKLYFVISVLNEHNIRFSEIVSEKVDFLGLKKLKVFSFIINNNFDVALRLISTQLDIFLLGKLFSSEVVGIYKIAKEVSKAVLKLSSPVYQSIYPEFSKLIANQQFDTVKSTTIKLSCFAGALGMFFYLIFYLIGKELIVLAFGEEMIEAYYVSLVYIIAVIINLISLPFPSLMHAMGLAKEAFYNQLIASLLYTIILFFLVSSFSINGAAVSMIFFHLIWLIGSLIITQNRTQL